MKTQILMNTILVFAFLGMAGQGLEGQLGANASSFRNVISVLFTEDDLLVSISCDRSDACVLSLYTVVDKVLQQRATTPTTWLPAGRRLISGPNDGVFVHAELLSTPSFAEIRRLKEEPQIISSDGRLLGFTHGLNSWCVAPYDSSEVCLPSNPGRLLAITSRYRIVDKLSHLELLDDQANLIMSEKIKSNCVAKAQALRDGDVAIQNCGSVKILSSAGKTLLTVPKLVLPYDLIDSTKDGRLILVLRHRSTASPLQRASRLGVAAATLGGGVPESVDDEVDVSVLNSISGKECLLRKASAAMTGYQPVAAISPDGNSVAIGSQSGLQLIDVRTTCP